MGPNFNLLDTQAPERISRNVLALQAQNEQQQMQRMRMQGDQEDRQMRNVLAQHGLQQRQQEHGMQMIPKIAQLLYADPSDNTIDALAQVYSEATGQDVSQFAAQLKQMPPEQRKQVALSMGQKYDPKFQALNLGDRYQGVQVGPDGMTPVGQALPIANQPSGQKQAPVGYIWDETGTRQMPVPGGPADPESPINKKKSAPKPLPASTSKLINEELTSIGTFSGIDKDLEGFEKQIEDGKLEFGVVSNLINTGRNKAGFSTPESRNLESFKTKLENLRNSVLLLNKGVQTEGDAQRAMNEIMTNINDKELVKQRLQELRVLNRRAVDLRKNNVDTLRSTYGHDPFEFEKYENQPGTTNLTPQKNSKGWTLHVDGAGNKAYVGPNGEIEEVQ
jgi:hypothetical protein